jgi:hypothetical protein
VGAKMPAEYWRAYRARRRAAGNPLRRREGYVRDRTGERKYRGLGRPKRVVFPTSVAIPLFDSHPLVDEAVAALSSFDRRELARDMDSGARDQVGEYVLAVIEGRDPVAAMMAVKRRLNRELRELVHGTSLVDGLER